VKIDVRVARQDVRQLRVQRRIVAFRCIPLAADRPAHAGREWAHHDIVRIVVIERRAKEPPDYRRVGGRRDGWTSMDVCRDQIIIEVRRLPAREIDIEDRGGEPHRRHRVVQYECRDAE